MSATRVSLGAVFAFVAVSLALVGCGSEKAAPEPTTSADSRSPLTDISFADRCAVDVEGARSLEISTEKRLYAVEVGDGPRGVVLVHGSGSQGLCNWSAELTWLRDAELHVLAYDQACVGASDCASSDQAGTDLRAVVARLKAEGAVSVVVVAASAGGPLAIELATDADSGAAAAIALSPVGQLAPESTNLPLLIAAAPDDGSVDLAQVRAVRSGAPALVTLDLLGRGSGHAQELLYAAGDDERASSFREEFLQFIARHTRTE